MHGVVMADNVGLKRLPVSYGLTETKKRLSLSKGGYAVEVRNGPALPLETRATKASAKMLAAAIKANTQATRTAAPSSTSREHARCPL
ncbi:hypothetical protein HPB47_003136 [Ixodes persulcatus]|uniref:Uncharacterized protein n=1 Tax=Ixodes persulcatus TaxID=34615 RepID=A0AC60PJB2_IXOPE|nr:hypothetical protein HPB47_003136 [Ixodes persulcatus]